MHWVCRFYLSCKSRRSTFPTSFVRIGISGTDPVFESPFDGRMAGWRIFKFGTVRGAKRTLVEHREENLDRASQSRRPGGFERFAVGGAIYRGFCASKIRDNTNNAALSHNSNRSTISNSTTINSHLTKRRLSSVIIDL